MLRDTVSLLIKLPYGSFFISQTPVLSGVNLPAAVVSTKPSARQGRSGSYKDLENCDERSESHEIERMVC